MRERLTFPFARPALPPVAAWAPYLDQSYAERWFSNDGPAARLFEARLAARIGGDREVLITSSATAGLTVALHALGIGPGARVAVPTFTFPATAHAVAAAGAEVWLCDVDPDTFELSPGAAAHAVEDAGCAAVLHVRTLGSCRDLRPMEEICAALGVPLVVDAASSFGAVGPSGVPAGRAGDAEVFSFHATKAFAIGEGGGVCCAPWLAEPLRRARNFALVPGDVAGPGTNAKLAEPAAAIGLATLDVFDEQLEARRSAATRLLRTARGHGVDTRLADAGLPAFQGIPLVVRDPEHRATAVAVLAHHGIEARTYYAPPLHATTNWRATAAGRQFPVADALAERILCVPVYADLTRAELDRFDVALDAALGASVR